MSDRVTFECATCRVTIAMPLEGPADDWSPKCPSCLVRMARAGALPRPLVAARTEDGRDVVVELHAEAPVDAIACLRNHTAPPARPGSRCTRAVELPAARAIGGRPTPCGLHAVLRVGAEGLCQEHATCSCGAELQARPDPGSAFEPAIQREIDRLRLRQAKREVYAVPAIARPLGPHRPGEFAAAFIPSPAAASQPLEVDHDPDKGLVTVVLGEGKVTATAGAPTEWQRPRSGPEDRIPDDETLRALPLSGLIRLLGGKLVLYTLPETEAERRAEIARAEATIAAEIDRREAAVFAWIADGGRP